MPQKHPEYVTPSEARGLGWWVQAAMEQPRTRFLVASLLGMTVLGQGCRGCTYPLSGASHYCKRILLRRSAEKYRLCAEVAR